MKTFNFAVIGHPIGHTLSPFIHEKLFALDKINATYNALDVLSLDSEYENVLKKLNGYNVTIPYKEEIIKKLDVLSEKANLCSSVNTVKNDDKAYGYTTDGYGFIRAVNSKFKGESFKKVLIYGCGGASRAIAFECALNGCELSFNVREKSVKKAQILCDELTQKLGTKTSVLTNDKDESFDLLVNATPVGMHPNTNGCIASDTAISNSKAVFDAVYNPLETTLIKKAKENKKIVASSLDMLVYQAAKAHEIWVGATYTDDELLHIIEQTKELL